MNPKIKSNISKEQYELILNEYRNEEFKNSLGPISPRIDYVLDKFFNNEELNINEYKTVFNVIQELSKKDKEDKELKVKVEDEIINNPQETIKDIAKNEGVDDNTLSWVQSVIETERNTNKKIELGVSFYIKGEEKTITLIVDMEKLKYEFISFNDVMGSMIASNPEWAEKINKENTNEEFTKLAIDKYEEQSRELLSNVCVFKGMDLTKEEYGKFWLNIDENVLLIVMDKLKELLNPNSITGLDFFQIS